MAAKSSSVNQAKTSKKGSLSKAAKKAIRQFAKGPATPHCA